MTTQPAVATMPGTYSRRLPAGRRWSADRESPLPRDGQSRGSEQIGRSPAKTQVLIGSPVCAASTLLLPGTNAANVPLPWYGVVFGSSMVTGWRPSVVVIVPLSAGPTSVPAGSPSHAEAVAPAWQYTAGDTCRSLLAMTFDTFPSRPGMPPKAVAFGAPVTGAPHQQ